MTPIDQRDLDNLVNYKVEDAEANEYEQKIDLLENSRIVVRCTPNVHARLTSEAEFHGKTVEEWCQQIIEEHMTQMIGKPFITGPTKVSGKSSVKITGPSDKIKTTRFQ